MIPFNKRSSSVARSTSSTEKKGIQSEHGSLSEFFVYGGVESESKFCAARYPTTKRNNHKSAVFDMQM